MGTYFFRQALVIVLLLSMCIAQAVSAGPLDLAAQLPSSSELLSETGLKDKHSISLSDTMNFDDCLNYKVEAKFKLKACKLLFIIPSPGLEIKFTYQEPNALLEAGCIRGKSMLKSAQNAASQILTAGIKTPDEQRCVAPLQSQHGQATRYFDDTLVWAITPVARAQGSGNSIQVLQSYTCEYLKMFSMIITIAKFASNIDWSNFKSIGDSLKGMFNDFKQGIIDGFNEFKDALVNLPATIQTTISDTIGNIKTMFTDTLNQIKDLKNVIPNKFNELKTGLADLKNKISTFSPSETITKFKNKVGSFTDSVKNKLADIGKGGMDFSKDFKNILSNKFVANLPYVSDVNAVFDQIDIASGAFVALKDTPAGNTLSLTSLKTSVQGIIANGQKTLSSMYDQAADMLEHSMVSLDDSVYHIRLASNGTAALPSEGNVRGLITKLREAADEARLLEAEIQKHADVLEDIDYIIGQLGGETQPMEVSLYTMGPRGIQTDGFLENGGSQTALNNAREAFEAHLELLDDVINKAETWQGTLQRAQLDEVCRAYFDFEKGVETMTTFKQTVNAQDFVTGVYPEATYLAMGYVQYVQEDKPSPSCPLTSAGFVMHPAVNEAPSKEIKNCEWVCGSGRRYPHPGSPDPEEQNCALKPQEGAYMPEGGTCSTNRLSQVTEDGYYPACNGLKNELQYDRGEDKYKWTGGFNYVSTVDHRQILENRRASSIRSKVQGVLSRYQTVLSNTRRLMLAKNITTELCEPYRPIEVNEEDLEISSRNGTPLHEMDADMHTLQDVMQRQLALTNARPDYGMRKASNPNNKIGVRHATLQSLGVPTNVKNFNPHNVFRSAIGSSRGAAGETFGGSMAGVESKLAAAMQKVDEFVDLFNKGAFQQRMANAVTSYYPFGLSLAFNSANSTWQKHRLGKESLISNAIYSTHAGMIPWMLCSGSAALNSFIGSELINMQSLMSKLNCVGAWGLANEHGFTYNQNGFVRKMLVAKRGLNVAAKLKGVQPNLVGIGQFNLDYPFLYSSSQTPYTNAATSGALDALTALGVSVSKGHSHKGSGCYDYGTTDTSWYTPGEAGSSNEAIAQVNLLNAASGVANSVKSLNPLSDQADLGGDRVVATSWKKTACVAKFDITTITSTLATGLPAPCEFSILY